MPAWTHAFVYGLIGTTLPLLSSAGQIYGRVPIPDDDPPTGDVVAHLESQQQVKWVQGPNGKYATFPEDSWHGATHKVKMVKRDDDLAHYGTSPNVSEVLRTLSDNAYSKRMVANGLSGGACAPKAGQERLHQRRRRNRRHREKARSLLLLLQFRSPILVQCRVHLCGHRLWLSHQRRPEQRGTCLVRKFPTSSPLFSFFKIALRHLAFVCCDLNVCFLLRLILATKNDD